MGPTEIPSQSTETIKIPTANYEFGANYIDPNVSDYYSIYIVKIPWNCLIIIISIK